MSKEAKLGIYASENFRRSCYQQQRSLMRIIARDRQRFMEETFLRTCSQVVAPPQVVIELCLGVSGDYYVTVFAHFSRQLPYVRGAYNGVLTVFAYAQLAPYKVLRFQGFKVFSEAACCIKRINDWTFALVGISFQMKFKEVCLHTYKSQDKVLNTKFPPGLPSYHLKLGESSKW